MGSHRADIVTPKGTIVELQHGSLAVDDALERERHYKKMVWLLDGTQWGLDEWGYPDRFSVARKGGYWTFRWKWCWRWVLSLDKPVFVDRGDFGIFQIRKIYGPERAAGWGLLHKRQWFVDVITGESG